MNIATIVALSNKEIYRAGELPAPTMAAAIGDTNGINGDLSERIKPVRCDVNSICSEKSPITDLPRND